MVRNHLDLVVLMAVAVAIGCGGNKRDADDQAVDPLKRFAAEKAKVRPLERLTAELDRWRDASSFAEMFEASSKRYRAELKSQADKLLDRVSDADLQKAIGMTRADARKLGFVRLMEALGKLHPLRGVLKYPHHVFVRAEFSDNDTRAVVHTTQGVDACRRWFVREDGRWRLDKPAACEPPKPSQQDEQLFPKLLRLSAAFVVLAERHAGDCDKLASSWEALATQNKRLVDQRRAMHDDPRRIAAYKGTYPKETRAFTERLLPILKNCANNPRLRQILVKLK